MYLSDRTIKEMGGDLLTPFNPEQVNPCSYDLTLGDKVVVHAPTEGSVRLGEEMYWFTLDGERVIYPGEFLLATTRETVSLPDDLAAQVCGKSSVGRTGLFIQNAGHIDPGFRGQITLEVYNAGPSAIRIAPGDRIAQLVFVRTEGSVESPYDGKYQNQEGPTPPRWKKEERDG